MERRKFLASSLAASALAVTAPGGVLEAAQGDMIGERPGVLPAPPLSHQFRPAAKTV